MTKEHPPEEIKNRLSNIGEEIGNIALDYIVELEADNRLLEQRGSDILKELLDKNKRCIELKKENRLLGERCNQLLKDKGNLTDQIEKMKQCGNCGNRTIGNCEYCKRKPSQIFADTLTSDYWRLKEIKENG